MLASRMSSRRRSWYRCECPSTRFSQQVPRMHLHSAFGQTQEGRRGTDGGNGTGTVGHWILLISCLESGTLSTYSRPSGLSTSC